MRHRGHPISPATRKKISFALLGRRRGGGSHRKIAAGRHRKTGRLQANFNRRAAAEDIRLAQKRKVKEQKSIDKKSAASRKQIERKNKAKVKKHNKRTAGNRHSAARTKQAPAGYRFRKSDAKLVRGTKLKKKK